MWHHVFDVSIFVFNLVILSYFFLGNGIYTLLMVLSLGVTWLHSRRLTYQGLEELRESAATPPVTIIIPAWNEERIIVASVQSALETDYPGLQVIVVDDGSADSTVRRLVAAFHLLPIDWGYESTISHQPIRNFYVSSKFPNLLVVQKARGGKPDALNAGIDLCRTPYFCNLDADCLLERDALLRLMEPIMRSSVETVVSGGIVRVVNGCETENGRVVRVGLPQTVLERFQVVEYLRSFLFGRTGWDVLGGTLIVSGAFAIYQHKIVVEAGGFSHDTVTEDMDLIVQLHRWAGEHQRAVRLSFTSDPVCWTECPASLRMLARQRRRWQLGLCQTLWKHAGMLFRPKYGTVGCLSFPFHFYVEGLGAAVEFLGYFLVPLAIALKLVPPAFLVLFILLGLVYGGFLSVGAVLLEELTYRRYPRFRDLVSLLAYAVFENVGYRQLVLFFRFQGILKFLLGFRRWEKVAHYGAAMATRILLLCCLLLLPNQSLAVGQPPWSSVPQAQANSEKPAPQNDELENRSRERLSVNPEDLEALAALAALTANPQRCREGLPYARRAANISPNDPSLVLTLARSLAACGQGPEATTRYQRVLAVDPTNQSALAELGDLLLSARKFSDAAEVFGNLLRTNPQSTPGNLGMARISVATGQFPDALRSYDRVLVNDAENYDALQGKAFLYLWNQTFDEAQRLFVRLAERRPGDSQNAEALQRIARSEEELRWSQPRPPVGAPPESWLAFHTRRLTRFPHDLQAIKGLGATHLQLKNSVAARLAYQRALELDPNDRDAKLGLAQALIANGKPEDAIPLFRAVSEKAPNDVAALEGLERAYARAGRSADASAVLAKLAAMHPSNIDYQLEQARLDARLGRFETAGALLHFVLAADPKNLEARLELAQLQMRQERYRQALRNFNEVLKSDPANHQALLGNARIAYYRGETNYAHALASKLVEDRPDDFDAVFLLANLERARHEPRRAHEVLTRASQLSPGNAEVHALEETLRDESAVTLHTSASFAREIGTGGQWASGTEDLRAFSYETTVGFRALPKTDSKFSLYYLPSSSPTFGIRGAVAPAEFLYRQSTWISPHLTVRGGAGLIRFGPGDIAIFPPLLAPIRTPELHGLGFANFTYSPHRKMGVDVTVARSALTFTPTSVRLGVMEDRFSGGLNFYPYRSTELHLEYFYSRVFTPNYEHVTYVNGGTRVVQNKADHDRAHGGTANFTQALERSRPFSFEVGYSGLAFGYAGHRDGLFLGFFNPGFYQRHYLTARSYGELRGRVGYDFQGGIGVQQVEQGMALTRALLLSPALTFKMSRAFSFTLGYIHYNSAQTLGTLSGDAVRLATDWKF